MYHKSKFAEKEPLTIFSIQCSSRGMQTLLYINPLKAGKLKEYKAFSAGNIGPRKHEYTDMLKRYGLRDTKVYYHKMGGKEFVVVTHEAEDNALKLLEGFASSPHPYDKWFMEQLIHLHDFDGTETRAECLFQFNVRP
jgi:hypothetical protein